MSRRVSSAPRLAACLQAAAVGFPLAAGWIAAPLAGLLWTLGVLS